MIANRTVFTGDNLPILRGMDSESVDLIYLDPPFNSNRQYAAPIDSKAAGASFKDAWTFEDTDAAWWGELADTNEALYSVIDAAGKVGGKGDKAYLIYMAIRLLEMQRILKPSGSVYLHCDPTMSHGLKLTLDAIFGKSNFLNEVVWSYKTGGTSKRWFGRKHDIILVYRKTHAYKFNFQKEKSYLSHKYGFSNITIEEDERGHYTLVGMRDVWDIPALRGNQPETVGYPTQKPRALLERIIKASSNPDDLVFDPFCGCATTCIAAELLSRRWVGIDISEQAVELVKSRAANEIGGLFPIIHRTDIPLRDAPPRSRNIKHLLFGQQEGVCPGCKVSFQYQNFTLDHIVPKAKGGADTDDNLQLLCGHCNSIKGNRDMAYLLAQITNPASITIIEAGLVQTS